MDLEILIHVGPVNCSDRMGWSGRLHAVCYGNLGWDQVNYIGAYFCCYILYIYVQ